TIFVFFFFFFQAEDGIRDLTVTGVQTCALPIFAQGANDPRVNHAESEQIVVALRDRGFPVEYLLIPDEGHGFARPINNMASSMRSEERRVGKECRSRRWRDD